MQLLIGAGLAGVALTIPTSRFLQLTPRLPLAARLQLRHARHRRRRFLHARTLQARPSLVCRNPQYLLSARDDHRAGIAHHPGRLHRKLPPACRPSTSRCRPKPAATVTAPLDPDSIVVTQQEGDLRLIASSKTVAIDLARRTPEEVNALLDTARTWNQAQGFYAGAASASSEEAGNDEPSWWQRSVVQKLETTLADLFGPERAEVESDAQVGNVGVVFFTLSGPVPPGEDVVVNFGRESGDTSIQLVEGDRFTYTEANWDRPFMAVIQL